MKQKPFIAVSSKLASAIREMDAELKKSFGCDYSYTIMGHGEILAASNLKDGRIEPVENPQSFLQRPR